jgi:hypothetical protein
MTDDPGDKAGTEGENTLLQRGESALDDLITAFRGLSRPAGALAPAGGSDVSRSKVALASVRATILDEVRRHEAWSLNADGAGRATQLDLEAARTEIGRRLDRIRNARGAG